MTLFYRIWRWFRRPDDAWQAMCPRGKWCCCPHCFGDLVRLNVLLVLDVEEKNWDRICDISKITHSFYRPNCKLLDSFSILRYLIHYLGFNKVFSFLPIKIIWSFFVALFRTHAVCNMVVLAADTLKAGKLCATVLRHFFCDILSSYCQSDEWQKSY